MGILGLISMLLIAGSVLLMPYGQSGFMLLALLGLISIVGFLAGQVIALGLSLILFFMLGSILFWMSLSNTVLFDQSIPMEAFLLWMGLSVVVAIASGTVSVRLRRMHAETIDLRTQIHTLVAVDPVTGFDNKERLMTELNLEFSRSKRYGHTFTLLLIRMNHIESFIKLYGQKEFEHVLQHVATEINKSTRLSDHKFRADKDTFALLLPGTPLSDIGVVIEKLHEKLELVPVKRKKGVTIPFTYGYAACNDHVESVEELYGEAEEQVLANVS